MRSSLFALVLLCLSTSAFAQTGDPAEAATEAATEATVEAVEAAPAAVEAVAQNTEEGVPATEAPVAQEAVTPAATSAPAAATEAATSVARAPASYLGSDTPDIIADAHPTPRGATGLMRTYSASGLEPGSFGLFLYTSYFSGKDVVVRGDEARRFIGNLGLSYQPIEYLEVWASLSARATTNTFGDPRLIQSVGDLGLGVKGMYEVSPGLHLALLLNLDIPAGSNSVGIDFSAASFDVMGLFTMDFRDIAALPLRTHVNIGLRVDRSVNIFGVELERVEQFGHNIYEYNVLQYGIGVDAPLPYATPFAELAISQPLGAPCVEDPSETQICVGNSEPATWPMWATIGVRSQPVRGLAFTAAADLGLTTKESQGTPAIPAWSLLLGASYNLDPRGGGATRERIVEVPVEVPVGVMTSYVEGFVRETGGGAAIAGAQIEYINLPDFTPQTTDSTGRFRSYDFEPGTALSLRVTHPDYVASDFDIVVGTEIISGPVELDPAFDGVLFSGTVEMASSAPTMVSLRGEESYDLVVEDGEFTAEVAPGEYIVTVHALGYEGLQETMTLSAGRVEREFALQALDPNAILRFTADALVIDSPLNRVDFENGALTPQATETLDAVVGVLNARPALRVLVRSHTDPREEGAGVDELGLTAERAQAVKDYLVANGISAARLEIDGVGSAEPQFPNVTDRNRRFNNRVEFEILR